MSKFIGRREELRLLDGLLTKESASLVVVYGRRRIGKSRLIEEFGRRHRFISFSGLFPHEGTKVQDQLDEFYRRFKERFELEPAPFTDWGDAFHALASHTQSGRVIILLDEISWMSTQDPNFLGKLKNAWDMEFKKNDKLILILCGSVSIWIEENILSSSGFYGRVSLKIRLRELPIRDCEQFWEGRGAHTSDYEKFKILSVMGGIPKYLEEIRVDQSADENIRRLCFSRHGQLYNDYDTIFVSLLERKSRYYQAIVELLSLSPLERGEISDKLGIGSGRVLSEYLEELTVSGFLHRDYTWYLKSGKHSKLSKYRLADNYLRFYIKYIQPNVAKIENDQFENHSISALPGWSSIIGLQVENLVLNNRKQVKEILGIYPDEVICDGPFFQRKTGRQKGCQIDYMIQTKFGVLYLCEIKFSRRVIRATIIEEVQEKITRLSIPRNFSIKPVLIYIGDVHDDVLDSHYFAKMLDMSELLHHKE